LLLSIYYYYVIITNCCYQFIIIIIITVSFIIRQLNTCTHTHTHTHTSFNILVVIRFLGFAFNSGCVVVDEKEKKESTQSNKGYAIISSCSSGCIGFRGTVHTLVLYCLFLILILLTFNNQSLSLLLDCLLLRCVYYCVYLSPLSCAYAPRTYTHTHTHNRLWNPHGKRTIDPQIDIYGQQMVHTHTHAAYTHSFSLSLTHTSLELTHTHTHIHTYTKHRRKRWSPNGSAMGKESTTICTTSTRQVR